MTTSRDPDRMIHAFVLEGEEQLHDQVYDAIRAEIEQKRQRAVIGPWRFPLMNKLLPIGVGAAAVLGVLLLGYQLLGTRGGVGGNPTPTLSPSPSPTLSSSAAPSQALASPPPLTQTFTSERYGFSMSYPVGWVARPATESWTTGVPDFAQTNGDIVYDPTRADGQLWIAVASQSLGASTPKQWMAETLALDDGCRTSEPIAIDGASGVIGPATCTRAAVTVDGRGYIFWHYTGGDDPSVSVAYDGAWFAGVLRTVQLLPQDAVDGAPSASL